MNDQEWIAKLRDALEIPDIRSTDEPDAVVETLETEVTGLRAKVEEQKDKIADLQQMPQTARRTAKRALMRQSSRATVLMVTTSTRNIIASITDRHAA